MNKDLSISKIKYDKLKKENENIVQINKKLEIKIYNFKSEIDNSEINKNSKIVEKTKQINELNNLFLQTTQQYNHKTKELESTYNESIVGYENNIKELIESKRNMKQD